jgi:hypothetical protein
MYLQGYNLSVHTVFVFFVSFVAYATGAVLCKRVFFARCCAVVGVAEMLFVTCLLLLIARPQLSRLASAHLILLAFAMLITGAIVARIVTRKEGRATAGTREFENISSDTDSNGWWKRWLNFSHAVVDHEFRLFLVAVYLFLIGPFAIIFHLLSAKPNPAGTPSGWIPRKDTPSLDTAKRPF